MLRKRRRGWAPGDSGQIFNLMGPLPAHSTEGISTSGAGPGRGTVVIDPKGDLITDLLARLPERVADRVVLFNPAERHARPTLNVLQGPDPHRATDNLDGIFARIYKDFEGPGTDDILRSACLTL